jgi:hypothetical protein
VVTQDVSDTAWGGFFDDGSGTRTLARGALKKGEGAESSTLRELKAADRNLETFAKKAQSKLEQIAKRLRTKKQAFSGRHVLVYTDNQTAARTGKGSSDPVLQKVIKRIHATAMWHSFTVVFRWRRHNTKDLQLGDDITKIGMCDYAFRQDLFESLQKRSGR